MGIRVSLVDYLNAAPLGWAFLKGPFRTRFEIIRATPAACAQQLATGHAQIGLIPSIEYQRIPDLRIIPGISISAIHNVRSVLLIRPHNSEGIETVALDSSSRTSVVLLKLILRQMLPREPQFIVHPPNLKEMLQVADAALLIGDNALSVSPDDYEISDLAEAWCNWQNKPFVFAFWACRSDLNLPSDIVSVFQEARDFGLANMGLIADAYRDLLKLPKPFIHEYLQSNIDYDMNAGHVSGLESFYNLAHEHGFIEELIPIQFMEA